jgi:hypothetical protein
MNTKTTVAPLGRLMPTNLLHTVTVAEHWRNYFAFCNTDVWTGDGWLLTAVCENGLTHHMRKGDQNWIRPMDPTEVLHFVPTAETTIRWGRGA